jgi:hypothetical protein
MMQYRSPDISTEISQFPRMFHPLLKFVRLASPIEQVMLPCLAVQELAWLGLAWLGLAWLGLAWLGLAWLGRLNRRVRSCLWAFSRRDSLVASIIPAAVQRKGTLASYHRLTLR